MHRHDLDRVALTPLAEEIPGSGREPVVPAPLGGGRRRQRQANREPSLGRQRRPEPALAIDEQLREPPLSPLHLGEDSAPARPAGDLRDRPTGDPPATTENGVGILGGMDNRRRLLPGTVLGRDQKRVGELIPAIGHLDRDRRRGSPPLPQLADEVKGAAEGRHWPPRATISRVVASGSNMKLRRRRRLDDPTAAPRAGENPGRHDQPAENSLAPSAVDSHETPRSLPVHRSSWHRPELPPAASTDRCPRHSLPLIPGRESWGAASCSRLRGARGCRRAHRRHRPPPPGCRSPCRPGADLREPRNRGSLQRA